MTVLENAIHIDAPPDKVWAVLASLETLGEYDPGIKKVQRVSRQSEGIGAARQCDLTPGGWFKERVAEWNPNQSIAFELFECTLPVRTLHHRYTLTAEGGGTRVAQRMEYQLKFGKWNAGVQSFFAGLKRYVERTDLRK